MGRRNEMIKVHGVMVQVDSRKRLTVPMAEAGSVYLADVADDGVVTLTPAVVIPEELLDTLRAQAVSA